MNASDSLYNTAIVILFVIMISTQVCSEHKHFWHSFNLVVDSKMSLKRVLIANKSYPAAGLELLNSKWVY